MLMASVALLLLKKGHLPHSRQFGPAHRWYVVLRGEGDGKDGTVLVAAGKGQRTLLNVVRQKRYETAEGDKIKITDDFVPTGAKSFNVASTAGLKVGDRIILYRPSPEELDPRFEDGPDRRAQNRRHQTMESRANLTCNLNVTSAKLRVIKFIWITLW
jgi:hypothetical protein